MVVAIGDVHGCLEELDELLKLISFNPNNMRVVLLGDLMDRGPNPVGCVKRARELNLECIRGNHEDKHLRWNKHEVAKLQTGKSNPMKSMSEVDDLANKALSEEDIDWMKNLPYQLQLTKELYAVHAGVEPSVGWNHQNPAQLMRVRYVNDKGKAVSLNPDKSQPDNTQYWTEQYRGARSIVYGHYVHSLSKPRIDIVPDKLFDGNPVVCYGIDTGCCFGGSLTAMLIKVNGNPLTYNRNEIEFAQVKAKQVYFEGYHNE
jgi:diadenosine tetraphosphatase ApaH/serine/threonine PP2A family protein phosphatase